MASAEACRRAMRVEVEYRGGVWYIIVDGRTVATVEIDPYIYDLLEDKMTPCEVDEHVYITVSNAGAEACGG